MKGETMTAVEAFEHMRRNVEEGRIPGDGIEVESVLGNWVPVDYPNTADLLDKAAENSVRHTPRTITVAGVEVPEPMREVPEHGAEYWFVNNGGCVHNDIWRGVGIDYGRLRQGNVFATREGAEARAEAERRLFGMEDT